MRRHRHGDIVDIGVLAGFALDGETKRVVLEALGKLGNRLRHGCREHQRAAVFRRFAKDEFEVLAKAHVEHFVSFIENDGTQFRHVESITGDMVAQTSRRTDNDVGATFQRTTLGADIHTANAGCNARTGIGIEPFQLTTNLKRQFARRRDNHGKRRTGIAETQFAFEDGVSHGKAESNRLARSGLCGNEKIGIERFGCQNGILNGGECIITASG